MKIDKPQALNEQGRRQNQEDSIFPAKGAATSETRTFIVCDGMGGHSHGEVASAAVCESFAASLAAIPPEAFDEAAFNQALDSAYDALDARDSPEHASRMGTTLALLHLSDCEAFLAHIGDSRIYHLRTSKGKARIVHRTSDHSLVNELLVAGVITPEEARVHPKKNVITRAMQPHEESRPRADIYRTSDVRAGDWFFICSDGVTESLDEETLLAIIAAPGAASPGDAATRIEAIRKICAADSRDNFSAWLVPVAEGIGKGSTDVIADRVGGADPDESPADDASGSAAITPETAAVTDPPIPFALRTAAPHPSESKPARRKWGLGLLIAILLVAAIGVAVWFFMGNMPT